MMLEKDTVKGGLDAQFEFRAERDLFGRRLKESDLYSGRFSNWEDSE
jgi:hypothetical protein